MVPEGTLIATDTVVICGKTPITMLTKIFPAVFTSPGFIRVLSMQFYFIVRERGADPVIFFFTSVARNGVIITDHIDTPFTFCLIYFHAVSKPRKGLPIGDKGVKMRVAP